MKVMESQMVPRILRDMEDGVLVLDTHGHILFINDRGRALLGIQPEAGKTYASAFLTDSAGGANDQFHQFVLDAVYDKESTHSGEASYEGPEGQKHRFRLTSSFLRDEHGKQSIGIVVVFSDITELERLNMQRRESSVIFAVLMICVCAYLFLWSFLRMLSAEPEPWVMSLMIEGMSVLMFVIILKMTSFSIRDIGLRIADARATFVPAVWITVIVGAALVAGKWILLRLAPGFFPENAPFWDWSVATPADLIYPLTVVLQEFLARGVMQESLNRIFIGRHAAAVSILVSALVFGVLHIAYGLPYMVGASLLLGVLGILYHKQGNIWGLCIIHYVLGEMATFLRYLV